MKTVCHISVILESLLSNESTIPLNKGDRDHTDIFYFDSIYEQDSYLLSELLLSEKEDIRKSFVD